MSPRSLDFDHSFDATDDEAFRWTSDTFETGERICPPARRAASRPILSTLLLLLSFSSAAWSYVTYPDVWRSARDIVRDTASALLTKPEPVAGSPLPQAQSVPPAPLSERMIAEAPGQQTGTPVAAPAPIAADATVPVAQAQQDTNETPEGTPDVPRAAEPPQPLPKPVADPADPQQRRALAAGLHPDVSRAVLARLSPADFRNARFAIAKALAETADGDTFAWPAHRKATDSRTERGAEFEVRFVASAASTCRRYVVTVTLDRWSTTAPAMEKCGNELPRAKPPRSAAG